MTTIRNARALMAAFITAAALSACAAPQTDIYAVASSAEVDKSCILTASNKLRELLHLEAIDGRVEQKPGQPGVHIRLVELDTTNAGMKVTYVFTCAASIKTGYTVASPLGRK